MLSGYEIVCSSNYLQIMIHRIATTGDKSFLGVYMDMSAFIWEVNMMRIIFLPILSRKKMRSTIQ